MSLKRNYFDEGVSLVRDFQPSSIDIFGHAKSKCVQIFKTHPRFCFLMGVVMRKLDPLSAQEVDIIIANHRSNFETNVFFSRLRLGLWHPIHIQKVLNSRFRGELAYTAPRNSTYHYIQDNKDPENWTFVKIGEERPSKEEPQRLSLRSMRVGKYDDDVSIFKRTPGVEVKIVGRKDQVDKICLQIGGDASSVELYKAQLERIATRFIRKFCGFALRHKLTNELKSGELFHMQIFDCTEMHIDNVRVRYGTERSNPHWSVPEQVRVFMEFQHLIFPRNIKVLRRPVEITSQQRTSTNSTLIKTISSGAK